MNFSIASRIAVKCLSPEVDVFSLEHGYLILKGRKRLRKQFQAAKVKDMGYGVTEATYPDGSKLHCSWNERDGLSIKEVLR